MRLRVGTEKDAPQIRALLASADLPVSDLSTSVPRFLVACDASDEIVAAGGLQWFGETALLRSVVVASYARGKGLGQMIVRALEGDARKVGAGRLVLLTLTAKSFFERQGYRVVERGSVPDDVQASEEFQSLCPASAICMAKTLGSS